LPCRRSRGGAWFDWDAVVALLPDGHFLRIGAVEIGTERGPCEAPRTPRNSSRVGVTLVG
jgi:hypothetical protein